jgi:hypothetical protein
MEGGLFRFHRRKTVLGAISATGILDTDSLSLTGHFMAWFRVPNVQKLNTNMPELGKIPDKCDYKVKVHANHVFGAVMRKCRSVAPNVGRTRLGGDGMVTTRTALGLAL